MVRFNLSSQDACTHQMFYSYLKLYKIYAPDRNRDGRTDGLIEVQCVYYMPAKVSKGTLKELFCDFILNRDQCNILMPTSNFTKRFVPCF